MWLRGTNSSDGRAIKSPNFLKGFIPATKLLVSLLWTSVPDPGTPAGLGPSYLLCVLDACPVSFASLDHTLAYLTLLVGFFGSWPLTWSWPWTSLIPWNKPSDSNWHLVLWPLAWLLDLWYCRPLVSEPSPPPCLGHICDIIWKLAQV